jgi:glycosyltransferase involved in cell wall biosynthesis
MPDVSVVLTTRDRWEVFKSMGLRSALIQEDVTSEIIVVDDGSTDATTERLRELAGDRITVITGTGRGRSHARNLGLAKASSEFVAFLDDDDAWSPHKLREQLNAAIDARADFVYSPALIVNEQLEPVAIASAPEPEWLHESLLTRNVIMPGGSNVLARTQIARILGGFDETLFFLEDWDFLLKLAREGRPAVCDQVLVAYLLYRRLPARRFGRDPAPAFQAIRQRFAGVNMSVRDADIAASRWRAFYYRRSGHRLLAAREYLRAAWTHRSTGNVPRAAAMLVAEPILQLCRRRFLPRPAAPEWLDFYR